MGDESTRVMCIALSALLIWRATTSLSDIVKSYKTGGNEKRFGTKRRVADARFWCNCISIYGWRITIYIRRWLSRPMLKICFFYACCKILAKPSVLWCLALVPNHSFCILSVTFQTLESLHSAVYGFYFLTFLLVVCKWSANLLLSQILNKQLFKQPWIKCLRLLIAEKMNPLIAFAWDLPSAKTASSEILARNSVPQFASFSKLCREKHCQHDQ